MENSLNNIPTETTLMNIKLGNAQDIGAREEQQDSFGISDIKPETAAAKGILAVIADGTGAVNSKAYMYAKTAVQTALQSFASEIPETSEPATLLRIVKRASDAVNNLPIEGGGCTFIGALIHNKMLFFVSVGDNRLYLMRNGGLIQMNREHVYTKELDNLVSYGLIDSESSLKNKEQVIPTSYIGLTEDMKIDRNTDGVQLYPGDKIILMTDGVYRYLAEKEMRDMLLKEPMEASESIRKAIVSKKYTAQDNLTIVVIEMC